MSDTNPLELLMNVLSMSSTEIATLTGKRHDHVLRDIDKMFLDLYPDETERNLLLPKFGGNVKNFSARGNPRAFNLDKRHTICLIAGYSSIARMRIIDRWQELEENTKSNLPQDEEEWALFALEKIRSEKRLKLENAKKDLVIEEQTDFIENHVHFPKYIKAEDYEDGNYMNRVDIRKTYFPELGNSDRLTLILSYYGCEKALYKNSKNMITEVFKVTEIEDIRVKFEDDLEFVNLSRSGDSRIFRHPALPNMELRIKVTYTEQE